LDTRAQVPLQSTARALRRGQFSSAPAEDSITPRISFSASFSTLGRGEVILGARHRVLTNAAMHVHNLKQSLDTWRERERERERERQTDRQTDRQPTRRTNRQTDGRTEGQRESARARERETEREQLKNRA